MMRLSLVLVIFALVLSACGEPMPPSVGSGGGGGAESGPNPAAPQPKVINVYDFGHVTRLEPGTGLFGRMGEAVRKVVVGHRFEVEGSGSSEPYVRNVKEGGGFGDASQRALELIYPEPGLRLGEYGPYTHVFMPFGQVRPEPLVQNTKVKFAVGNGRYDLPLSTRARDEVTDLLNVLNLVILRPAPGKGFGPGWTRKQEAEVMRVPADFLEAVGLSRTYRGDRALSREYEGVARLHLAPELNSRTPDLGRLGLLLPRRETEFVSVGWMDQSLKVRDDRATIITALSVSSLNGVDEQRVGFDFRRLDGQWKVTAIRPHKPTR